MVARYHPKGIHTANVPSFYAPGEPAGATPQPFLTIAQQIGTERPDLPQRLANLLEQRLPGGSWSPWDKELAQKVSSDSRIPAEVIDTMETSGHSWLDDLLGGIWGRVDEIVVFNRVKQTVRDLATQGHVILIGHGSSFMTRDMSGGLHVRLIAPRAYRIEKLAERLRVSKAQAAHHMRRIDRQRRHFFKRFWPDQPLSTDWFAVVFNVAELKEQAIAAAIAAMMETT